MRALIFEPNHAGHHLHFVALISEALLQLGHDVRVATSSISPGSVEWRAYMHSIESDIAITSVPLPHSASPLQQARLSASNLTQVSDRFAPDRVYVPYADGLTQWLAMRPLLKHRIERSETSFEALVLRARFAYPATGFMGIGTRVASQFSARFSPWTTTYYLDPLGAEALSRRSAQDARRYLMPEPVEQLDCYSTSDARARLGIPPIGRYIVLPGFVEKRKGADLLLRSFTEANLGRHVRLLFAGRLSGSLRGLVERDYRDQVDNGSLVLIDRYLTREEFWLAICAAEVVAVPYPRHFGSSSILARAAYAGKPVVSSDFGWVGEATVRYGLGWSANVADTRAFGAALRQGVESASLFRHDSRAQPFVAFNTPARFQRRWTEGIEADAHGQ